MLPTRNTDLWFALVACVFVVAAVAGDWSRDSLTIVVVVLDIVHAMVKNGGTQ